MFTHGYFFGFGDKFLDENLLVDYENNWRREKSKNVNIWGK